MRFGKVIGVIKCIDEGSQDVGGAMFVGLLHIRVELFRSC